MGSGEITGTGPERPGEDGGMREPKSPGQRVRATGLRIIDAVCGLGPWRYWGELRFRADEGEGIQKA